MSNTCYLYRTTGDFDKYALVYIRIVGEFTINMLLHIYRISWISVVFQAMWIEISARVILNHLLDFKWRCYQCDCNALLVSISTEPINWPHRLQKAICIFRLVSKGEFQNLSDVFAFAFAVSRFVCTSVIDLIFLELLRLPIRRIKSHEIIIRYKNWKWMQNLFVDFWFWLEYFPFQNSCNRRSALEWNPNGSRIVITMHDTALHTHTHIRDGQNHF